jgi:hypothetical protein
MNMTVPTWWMYYEDRLVNVARLMVLSTWAWFVLCFLVESAAGFTTGSSSVSIPMTVAMLVSFFVPIVLYDEFEQLFSFISNVLEMTFRTVLRCLVLLPILAMVFIVEFVQNNVLSLWKSGEDSESKPAKSTVDSVVHHRYRSVLVPLESDVLGVSEQRAAGWPTEVVQ